LKFDSAGKDKGHPLYLPESDTARQSAIAARESTPGPWKIPIFGL